MLVRVFPASVFGVGIFFLSAPFPDRYLLVPFHRKCVSVPADKVANNEVFVCRLHYVNTLKRELDGTRAYKETDSYDISVVYAHKKKNYLLSFLFVSMKTKRNFLRCIGCLSFAKDRIRLDLLLILVLVLPLKFLDY